jgi:amino acid transporter
MVVMPISAFLGFTGGINLYLGVIIALAVNIFALWLLYNGLVEALKSKPETTKIVVYVLIALFVLFMLLGLGARSRANRFMNEFKNSDVKELMKNMEKK